MPEELIAAAQSFDMPAMGLLDRDGVYGSPRFHLAAQKNGIKAHIGSEITVKFQIPKSKLVQSPKSKLVQSSKHSSDANVTFSLPLLVRTRQGYQNLCRLITLMKLRVPKHAKPGECAVTP